MIVTKLAATLIIVALAGWRGTESIKQDACSPIRDTPCKGQCSAECPVGCKKSKELDSCEPCSAGSFKNSTGDLDCLACPIGTFASKTGSTACSQCPAGTFANKTGSTACSQCGNGTFSLSDGVSCNKQCPAGTYSSGSTIRSCTKCAAGTYSSSSGSTSCSKCAAGTYSSRSGSTSCSNCFVGTYSRSPGSTSCSKCAAGTYSSSSGSSSCSKCYPGTYSSSSGSTGCLKCYPGTYSSSSGSTSCSECVPGTYSSRYGATGCEKCDLSFAMRRFSGKSHCDLCPNKTSAFGPNRCYPVRRIGCFQDKGPYKEHLRDLPIGKYSSINTPDYCVKRCRLMGYAYAGVQGSALCYCGNSYGRHGKVQDSECSMKCIGNSKHTCGSDWRNEVYSTGLNPVRRLGCYKDERDWDLPHLQKFFRNTPQLCVEHCESKGYTYAGVQSYLWCLCGNSYGRYGKLNDSECTTKCIGDSKQTCGGARKNEIYSTGLNPARRIGCFKDWSNPRDLGLFKKASNETTPDYCMKLCKSKGHAYAGVQAQDWCYCGNSYGRYGKVQDSECTMKCKGDSKQTCGSVLKNEVYSTGLNPLRRLGCFKDKASRDLPDIQKLNGNTPQLCIEHCKFKGIAYAGVQASAWCLCGNSYGRYGKLQDSECSMKCIGDSKQTCGHHMKNEIYST